MCVGDESGQKVDAGIYEDEGIYGVEDDRSGNVNHVRFADLISIRPIPSVGRGKPMHPRGRGAASAVWQSIDLSVDFAGVEQEPDILAWVEDRRARPAVPYVEEVGCVHAPTI